MNHFATELAARHCLSSWGGFIFFPYLFAVRQHFPQQRSHESKGVNNYSCRVIQQLLIVRSGQQSTLWEKRGRGRATGVELLGSKRVLRNCNVSFWARCHDCLCWGWTASGKFLGPWSFPKPGVLCLHRLWCVLCIGCGAQKIMRRLLGTGTSASRTTWAPCTLAEGTGVHWTWESGHVIF